MTTSRFDGYLFTLLVTLVLGAVACGDDDAAPRIGGGIDSGTRLSDLTVEQGERLCADAVHALRARVDTERLACTGVGILGASIVGGGEAACERIVAECLEEPPVAEDDTVWVYDCDFANPDRRAGCDATVAETVACLEDAIDTVATTLTCALADAELDDDPLLEPASCTALEERCPRVFGDDEGL